MGMLLYVDDEDVNRAVVRALLESAGLEMDEAADALSGLRLIGERDYQAVLMDLRMPVMDGYQAIREIRARGDAKANVPIVVVTADVTSEVKARCAAVGADDVVFKPVSRDRLLEAIGGAVHKRLGDAASI